MKIGPKYKIARRLGVPVFEKTQTQKFALSESRKNTKFKKRPMTDYAIQILEKQKARYSYLVSEKQFSNYVKEASKAKDKKPSEALFDFLERRLDNVVLRSGLFPSRSAARQAVSHGHFKVNGRKVDIPSFRVKVKDEITIKDSSQNKKIFENMEERIAESKSPDWISFDLKNKKIKVVGEPKLKAEDIMFDIDAVLEFYSR